MINPGNVSFDLRKFPHDDEAWFVNSPTGPYRFDAITVVLSPALAGRAVRTLADVRGLRTGVKTHGLPDLIAMTYREGELFERVVHFDQSHALFTQLENGDIDAALVDHRELDAWRLAHPETPVAATSYRHSIGFNIGLVGLATSGELIERIDAILGNLVAHGSLIGIAQSNGVTWLPPREPDVLPTVTLGALNGD